MSLTQKTTIGVIWNFTGLLGRRGISVVITLLLARFLSPSDYGLVAMMAVFLQVAEGLMESGFKGALIRLQGATQLDFNTVLYTNLTLGVISYLLLFFCAPLIAQFYDEPRLILLVRVSGLNIIINAFQVIQSAILTRELNFKAQFQALLPSGVISGLIAVALAYAGFGVWALITQMLVASMITTSLLWYLEGWRPSAGISRNSFKSMYNFGYKLFLSGLLSTIFKNIYVLVIAKMFSGAIVGLYFFSDKIKGMVISQLVGAIGTVTYPALASMQDDNIRLKSAYRKIIKVTTFLLFPVMIMLAALAEPLFRVLLPDKWLPAVLYLQLMCIADLLYPLHAINLNILKVKNRSDLFLCLAILQKIMLVIILFIAVRYGIIGILIGQIVHSSLTYIPNCYFSAKLLNYPIYEQMLDFMPGLALASAVALIIYAAVYLISWPAMVELLVFSFVAVVLYIGGAHVSKLQAFILARQIIMERINRR